MKWNCTQYLRNEEYPYKANLAVRIQQQNMQYPFIAYCSYSYTAYCVASTCTCVRAHTHTHSILCCIHVHVCARARTHSLLYSIHIKQTISTINKCSTVILTIPHLMCPACHFYCGLRTGMALSAI